MDSHFILSLEGSSATVSAAILRGETVLAETTLRADQAHAERILPAIEQTLIDANLCLDEIEAFAIAIGPGGFTSLRITVATLKGLAFALPAQPGAFFTPTIVRPARDIEKTPLKSACGGSAMRSAVAATVGVRPVAAVSTLEALAVQALVQGRDNAAGHHWLVPMLDARREEVYAAAYLPDSETLSGVREVLPESVYTLDELCARLSPHACLLGEGAAIIGGAIGEKLGSTIELVSDFTLRASTVGAIGARMLARGLIVFAEDLAPRYLRRAEAEVKLTGLRFESAH